MSHKEWIDLLKLPDGRYKKYLQDILQRQKDSSFSIPDHLLNSDEFIPRPPLRLRDTHVYEGFILKHVQHVPSLLEDLRTEFRLQLEAYLGAKGIPRSKKVIELLPVPSSDAHPGMVETLVDLVEAYRIRVGRFGLQYSTRMHLLPNSRLWASFVEFASSNDMEGFIKEALLIPVVDKKNIPKPNFGLKRATLKFLDQSTSAKLERYRSAPDGIALFAFYPPNEMGEDIIEQCATPGFKCTLPQASANIPTYSQDDTPSVSQDWEASFWTRYADSAPSAPKTPKPPAHQSKTVWIPGSASQQSTKRYTYTPNVSHFIQRAWNDAVDHDATFFLLSCGTMERICIRHRATNTLFISDVILPDDELYVLTHMAFYSALTRDFLAREMRGPHSKKTPPTDDNTSDMPSSAKRRKLDSPHEKTLVFDKEMSRRPVVLLTFKKDVYRSPAPSTFMRKGASCFPLPVSKSFLKKQGGRNCAITNCIYFQIQTFVGRGTEGMTYRGTVTLHLESGSTLEEGMIIKVGTVHYITQHLWREYSMYWKLATAGVSGSILKVYGIFEDVEMGHVILMMQDGGTTLEDREQKRLNLREPPDQYRISDAEYNSLKTTIQAINAAGVLHNDVKVNNIVVDKEGHIYIIDFGQSKPTYDYSSETDTDARDPPCSDIDTERLHAVEASIQTLPGIRSYDLQTIEDIYIGRYVAKRRYPDFD